STQRTVRGRGVGAAARGEKNRSGLVRKTPQALHREAVSVTLNLSPAGGSTMISRPQSQWIHPQETAQRGPTTNAPRGPPKCGAGGEEPVPDERNRCRVSDPEGGIDQPEIGVLRVFPGLRVLRGLRRPVAGTVARPAGGLPGRGRRAGPALLRTHLGGDAHGARV